MNSRKNTIKSLVSLLNPEYKSLKEDILERKCVTGIDSDFYEFASEMLGIMFDSSVWLFKGEEGSQKDSIFTISVGDIFDVESFVKQGYQRVERVWSEGEIAILGDVVLIWPYSMKQVVRISLDNNVVESIDLVDAVSRKKVKTVKSKSFVNGSSKLLVGNEEAQKSINLSVLAGPDFDSNAVDLAIRRIPYIDSYSTSRSVLEIVNNYKARGYKIVYITGNLEHFKANSNEVLSKKIDHVFERDGELSKFLIRGFVSSIAKVLLLTDFEVLGEVDLSLYQEKNLKMDPASVDILKKILPGDYIVHADHGIGRYVEISRKETGYYIEIAYAGKDRLYVPLSASEKLTKYVGAGRVKPKLTGLNSGVWSRISKKASERAEDIAKELLQLYALRKTAKRDPLVSSENSLNDFDLFVKKFEFRDTEDQFLATKHIVDDLQKNTPMDRLLVGDVGYGKTEIAMRACFAIVNEGYQVAVLAPTTVLVQQHIATFKERFKEYAFNISSLSRFSSNDEREEVLEGLEKGTVDIVIGTHSLLNEDVRFKNLGLLIIDEEQKFGVKQKEKIKGCRVNSNVLSLTATPIPRTLNMALVGIRDISVLATPPEGRKNIINTFKKFDWEDVRQAISKELERGGQVYFLHNRVATISGVYRKLTELFPNNEIVVVHGQMSSQELYDGMARFIQKESDILLCTTIIENGLDIPNVNTLIVDDASSLGLSQMYQIRGRIGRSERQAYAYFYYDVLKGSAELRLEAIKESAELGSGFLLSSKDLEIRGAGDILGNNQSGVINSVGYGLYTQLLNEAVEKLKVMGK